MKDLLALNNLKGHFKIEMIGKDGSVQDTWEQQNLIMDSARTTVAELFTLLSTNTSVGKIVLGTKGYNGDIRVPKTSIEGFVPNRDRLFSEPEAFANGQVKDLNTGDVFLYSGSTAAGGVNGRYYEYIGSPQTDVPLTSINFTNATYWDDLGTDAPYNYEISFDLPTTAIGQCANIVETDTGAGSIVSINQTGSDVTFTTELGITAGNGQNDPVVGSTTFTEAALYANGRIFSMKTFGAKIKDATVSLRITWTISF